MLNNVNEEALLRSLDSAAGLIRKGMSGKAGESAEKIYGIAYAKCVQAGLKPKLKRKYR